MVERDGSAGPFGARTPPIWVFELYGLLPFAVGSILISAPFLLAAGGFWISDRPTLAIVFAVAGVVLSAGAFVWPAVSALRLSGRLQKARRSLDNEGEI